MKKIFVSFLSIFIFFSYVDLAMISRFSVCDSVSKTSTISDIVKVQYELLQKTKEVVLNVCDRIAKDVMFMLQVSMETKKAKIVSSRLSICRECVKCCMLSVFSLIEKRVDVSLCSITRLSLFFFGFIFLFILKYLGLLFTFGKKVDSQIYKKAYSM